MPMIVKEQDLFVHGYKNVSIAIPVNTSGIAGAGLALWAKKTNHYWFTQYKLACENGKLVKKGYQIASTIDSSFVSIPTKHHPSDEQSDLDLIIRSLLAFEEGFKTDGPIGHGISTLFLPALGCGCGKLTWEEIEPKLQEALKDSNVNFVFCIHANTNPNRYSEKIIELENGERHFFFKGECPIGLIGKTPFNYRDPVGRRKDYDNPLHMVYDYLMFYLEPDSDVIYQNSNDLIAKGKEKVIEFLLAGNTKIDSHCKSPLQSYQLVKDHTFTDLVSGLFRYAISFRKTTDDDFIRFIRKLNELRITHVWYCGYEFPKVTGINMDIDKIEKDDIDIDWFSRRGMNTLGKLIKLYIECENSDFPFEQTYSTVGEQNVPNHPLYQGYSMEERRYSNLSYSTDEDSYA